VLVNNGGERRRRGKREDFFTVGPRVEVGHHRSDRWPPSVEPVSPYRFFRPTLSRTVDFDKFNKETLSVEPTYPRKFWSFSSILRFFSLNLLQIFYETLCIHLGRRNMIMRLQGHHRSDRCSLEKTILSHKGRFPSQPLEMFWIWDRELILIQKSSFLRGVKDYPIYSKNSWSFQERERDKKDGFSGLEKIFLIVTSHELRKENYSHN
jgi:hypothetical protein